MMNQAAHEKVASGQLLSAGDYAIIALAGFLTGIGLMFFYVDQVPNLVESGVQNQVFYLLLIPWALASAVFLFEAMRGCARFTHMNPGNTLAPGDPVVLLCLVLPDGFRKEGPPS